MTRHLQVPDTLPPVKATVETLEDDKVKLAVDVDDTELEKAIDASFKKLAKEVRIPGFRPGKAPRKVIESHLGPMAARGDALEQAIPAAYSEALREHQIDAIDHPEIDITAGETEGSVSFDAIVPVRPQIVVNGHGGISVEVPDIEVTDADIDDQIDLLRKQFASWETVERAAAEGDRANVDIETSQEGEKIDALCAEDYDYEVGLGAVVAELDEHLIGAKAGDEVSFDADHPMEDDAPPLHFEVKVHSVSEPSMPEVTDEWAAEASEFETVDELRTSVVDRLTTEKKHTAETTYQQEVSKQLSELCESEVPDALVNMEMQNQMQDLAMRLQSSGLTIEQYLQMTGQDPAAYSEQLRETGEISAKIDLVLRAVVAQEDLQATDDDLTEEFEKAAEQLGVPIEEVRERFESSGQVMDVHADISKRKAYEWIIERVSITTESGQSLTPEDLEHSHDDDHAGHDHAHDDHAHDDEAAADDDHDHDHDEDAADAETTEVAAEDAESE